MTSITIGQLLRAAARNHPDTPAIVEDGQATAYAEFDSEVDRYAAALLRLGVKRGDHVAVWLPNSKRWVALFCACARIGAALVPVNTRYKAEEASYVIAQSDARVLVMQSQMWSSDYHAMLCSMAPDLVSQDPRALQLSKFPQLRNVLLADKSLAGTLSLDAMLVDDAALVREAEAAVLASDLLLICYTSGTTGKPKGVMHSHAVIPQSTRVGTALHVEAGDRILGHMPFHHVAGLYMALVPALALGATLLPMREWNTAAAAEIITNQKVTALGGIPTHYFDLVDYAASRPLDTSSIKAAWIGGSPVPRETFERIRRTLGIDRLLSTYGMTENTISTTFNRWDDPPEICCQNKAPLLSDCDVKIVNPDTKADCEPGTPGEIWCRGSTVMLGYYKDEVATKQAITPDGWLRTGDLGHFDASGYLVVTGRLKEILKIGGINTSPVEIEEALARIPGVKSSVVVGVSDDRLGQVPYAYVQLDDGATAISERDITSFCREHLAHYKVPKFVRFVTEFPRTDTGKLRRAVLAQQAEDNVHKAASI
jgi:fatty-acyl-CoA synthase